MAINKTVVENRGLSSSHDSVFIKTRDETYDSMVEKKSPKHAVSVKDISMVENFIEEYSGGYNKKTLYEKFSEKLSLKEFDDIIEKLQDTGKVLIDREGKVCWTWNPELVKEIKENKKYASKWTH